MVCYDANSWNELYNKESDRDLSVSLGAPRDRRTSMYPGAWGPTFWDTLHIIGYTLPDGPLRQEKLSAVHDLLLSLSELLPCPQCAAHLRTYVVETPFAGRTGLQFRLWLHELHNAVNRRLKKKEPSFEEAQQMVRDRFFKIEDWIQLRDTELQRLRRLEDPSGSARIGDHDAPEDPEEERHRPHTTETPKPVATNAVKVSLIVLAAVVIAIAAYIITRRAKGPN